MISCLNSRGLLFFSYDEPREGPNPVPGGNAVILAAGLTPAWQQVLRFEAFTPGTVNRAAEVHWCASGKVLNAGRALHHLGGPCRALTVVGGTPGDEIRRDFDRLGIAARWVPSAAATRVCTTIVDAARHASTELVENA